MGTGRFQIRCEHVLPYLSEPNLSIQRPDPKYPKMNSDPPGFAPDYQNDNLHVQYSEAHAIASDAPGQAPEAHMYTNSDPYSNLRAPPPNVNSQVSTEYTENAPYLIHPSALHPPHQPTHLYSTIEPFSSNRAPYPNSYNPAVQHGIHIPLTVATEIVYTAPQSAGVLGAPEPSVQPVYGYNGQNMTQYLGAGPLPYANNPFPDAGGEIHTLQALLSPPPLQMLLQPFLLEGYSDLSYILTFDERQLQHMYATVHQRCISMGIFFTDEHVAMINSRLQHERNTRIRKVQSSFDVVPPTSGRGNSGMGVGVGTGANLNTNSFANGTNSGNNPNSREARMAQAAQLRQAKLASRANNQMLLCAMCGCGARSWMCLLVIAIIITIISLALLIAYLTLGKNADEQNSGTWTFVLVLYILGFVIAAILYISAFIARSMWSDGQINPYSCVCECCEDDGSPGFCEECCKGSNEPFCSCCSDFHCKACDGCKISCRDCCSCCECGECCTVCDDCCPDCCHSLRDCCMCCDSCDVRPPSCDCDCCPNIKETGCWLVCYKIVCCQCKIQLA